MRKERQKGMKSRMLARERTEEGLVVGRWSSLVERLGTDGRPYSITTTAASAIQLTSLGRLRQQRLGTLPTQQPATDGYPR